MPNPLVRGAPFTLLGAQVHNSSNYPEALKRVWPAVTDTHANTVKVPRGRNFTANPRLVKVKMGRYQ